MKFIKTKVDFVGENICSYILTNGLGGFSSSLISGENSRNEHGLFIASNPSPTNRIKLVDGLNEILKVGENEYEFTNQKYINFTKNKTNIVRSISCFKFKEIAKWIFEVDGVEVQKTISFKNESNTIAVEYQIKNKSGNDIEFFLKPAYSFVELGGKNNDYFSKEISKNGFVINSNGYYLNSKYDNFEESNIEHFVTDDILFDQDAVDGRNCIGQNTMIHTLSSKIKKDSCICSSIIFSTVSIDESAKEIIDNEIIRRKKLYDKNDDFIKSSLKLASDQFIVNRDSTQSRTIIAGYPFFGDWGRDTMFALLGGCLSTGRFDDAISIFKTFDYYLEDGLIPNLFPTDSLKEASFYNSVDAPLLFIWAIYEYFEKTNDLEFIKNYGIKIINNVIENFISGTKFSIKMDPEDALISAGDGYDQVTWMDVRFDKILPTPRHGKPVEINGFWYNALKIHGYFSNLLDKDLYYEELSQKVKISFNKYIKEDENGLLDVISGNDYDLQIRSNQIWTVSIPFSPLEENIKKNVVDVVYKHLYTTHGLRSLSPQDNEFKPSYGGSHFNRDMSYHQGTVWTFPLGGFYIAHLKVYNDSLFVKDRLQLFESILNQGCIGQVAEIYDGLSPTHSRGCYAQAWSVTEILRVYDFLN